MEISAVPIVAPNPPHPSVQSSVDTLLSPPGMAPNQLTLIPMAKSLPSPPHPLAKQTAQAKLNQTIGQLRTVFEAEKTEKEAKRAAMTPSRRRRDIVREVIENENILDKNIHHIHTVLALCGLPYRRPKGDPQKYQREYGKNSLLIQAGSLKNPETGLMEEQGLPYGPKARLLMLHLCTQAVRQKSPKIRIADSLSGFIRDMGFPVTGGTRGTITQFKEQLNRLAACYLTIGLWDGQNAATIKATPIKSFSVWLPTDPNQQTLWPSTVTFTDDFYKSLKAHALPIDIRALRAFTSSARQIDILFWLGYRMRSISKPYTITWSILQEQFGPDSRHSPRAFKQNFLKDMNHIAEVYPRLPLKLTSKGLMLFPADPRELLVPPKHARLS